MEKTPTDESTGLPLLIAPHDDVPVYLDDPAFNQLSRREGGDFADWNHVYHPRRDPMLQSIGGQAIRDSRGQLVLRSVHNDYHANFSGPELPQTGPQRFYTTVLCAAGYIPPQAITFRKNHTPQITTLSDEHRDRLRTSGEVRVMKADSLRYFMTEYALSRHTDHIKPPDIEEFLQLDPERSPEQADRQRFLAHYLLSQVVDRAAAGPLDAVYRRSHRQGYLGENAPSHSRDFVHRQITGPRHGNIRHITNLMRERFAAAVGLDLAAPAY